VALDADAILAELQSHAQRLGLFEGVTTHELKSAPGSGLRCEIWNQQGGPVPPGSGLNATSAVLLWQVRIRTNMLQEPQDAIDPEVVRAAHRLIEALTADFTLNGTVRNIDLLGAAGLGGLRWVAGYVRQDAGVYRVMDVLCPVIVNDAWEQLP
jgi:hypothetical protein